MDAERLTISVEASAKLLGISRGLAYQLAREGSLPGCVQLGQRRFVVSRQGLEEYLANAGRTTGAPK